jgi:hypothetical protein
MQVGNDERVRSRAGEFCDVGSEILHDFFWCFRAAWPKNDKVVGRPLHDKHLVCPGTIASQECIDLHAQIRSSERGKPAPSLRTTPGIVGAADKVWRWCRDSKPSCDDLMPKETITESASRVRRGWSNKATCSEVQVAGVRLAVSENDDLVNPRLSFRRDQ